MSLEKVVANLVHKVERRFYGKYRGFVVDNEDPEFLGRLKVQVPSLLGDEVVTGWAAPCLPYGGFTNQGILFVPEVDAGVWVEFEEGDLEFPIWTGTFWGKPDGESELPKPNDPDGAEQDSVQDPPTRKIIKTKKGHTIQFEDADDEEMIMIYEAVNGHIVAMNADGIHISDGANGHEIILNSDGISLTDGVNDGNSMIMNSDGLSLESGADVTIKGQNINIETDGKLAAKGNPIHLNP
ncbi:MAG: phage tail protein [Chloroflexi bacterium]|nr:phage tail protein [Chloroflexota bacterium]